MTRRADLHARLVGARLDQPRVAAERVRLGPEWSRSPARRGAVARRIHLGRRDAVVVPSAVSSVIDQNSKRTRVEPFFSWLRDNGGLEWPARFLKRVDGIAVALTPGQIVSLDFESERRVAPSARRLAWMIRNTERLAPRDGRRWREYQHRIIDNPRQAEALDLLDRGVTRGIDRHLVLEGKTSADCLIECHNLVIWIEGKRNDWLDYSTTWDVTRDQLARNTEATWLLAERLDKDFCLVICHEFPLKHHESLLVEGYRAGTWSGGWPHLLPDERRLLGSRIGTLTWLTLAQEWPDLAPLLK
jgi:hypothetical protein